MACDFLRASPIAPSTRATARTLTSVVVNWQISAGLYLKSIALWDSKAVLWISSASKLNVSTETESTYAKVRRSCRAPTASAAAACRRILKFFASLTSSSSILTMKSAQYAPTSIAESFCSNAATPRQAFHCVLAFPVVKQLAKLCAALWSHSCEVSKVEAAIRCPIPRVALARTLSPCSAALAIKTFANEATVSSHNRFSLVAFTAQRLANDHMAGIFTDFETSSAAMRSAAAVSSRLTHGR